MLQEEQVKIFLGLRRDITLLRKSRPYLDIQDFEDFAVKTHLTTLLKFFDKTGDIPTKDYYYHEIEASQPYIPDNLKERLNELIERKLEEREFKVALEYIKYYVKKKAILKTVERTSMAVANGDLDRAEESLDSFSNFKRIDEEEGTLLFGDLKHTMHNIMEFQDEEIVVPTFVKELDDALHGGFKQKELNIVLGLPGRGKTAFACHLAKAAALMRIPTLYISLEVNEKDVIKRIASSFTGVSISALRESGKFVEEKLTYFGKMCGDILVKQFATQKCSMSILRSYIKYVRAEFPFKFLIVDYGDLLVGSSFTNKERRHALELIFTDLRSLAVEEDIIVFSPSQSNRAALNPDVGVIQMEHASESFSKMMVADVVLSINQSHDEKGSNRMRIFIAKNRNGISNKTIPLYVDFSRTLFRGLRDNET